MIAVFSKNGVPIRITDERIKHIVKSHPEMISKLEKIIETIKNPDYILEGDFKELLAVKYYEKSPVTDDKYLIAVYKEINNIDGYIITAYYTRKISSRRKISWKP